jgi:DDE superfamily endonuclease
VQAGRPDDAVGASLDEQVDQPQHRRDRCLCTGTGQQLGTVLQGPGELVALPRLRRRRRHGGGDGLGRRLRVDRRDDARHDGHRVPGWRALRAPGPAVPVTQVDAHLGGNPPGRDPLVAASMASRSGLSQSTVGRIWRKFDLKPNLTDGFKLPADPLFVEKVVDVVGLYHNPPEKAVVLSVDEKSQVQALDRSQPVLPMMPGMPERRTHDYARHGVTGLFTAFDIANGTVISELHRRHRHQEYLKFLKKIDKNVPARLDVHLVCDNYATHKTPAIQHWLARHPRFQVHFTPTGLQLDQPGRALVRLPHRPEDPPRAPTSQSRPSKPTSATGSSTGTTTHAPSPGPRQPRRSSTHSPNIWRRFQAWCTTPNGGDVLLHTRINLVIAGPSRIPAGFQRNPNGIRENEQTGTLRSLIRHQVD